MSRKVIRPPFSWKVLLHDFNADTVRTYDVLAYKEDFIKKLKKKCGAKQEFIDALDQEFMWQYWSRSEYEMILYVENDRVYLEPWVGKLKDGRVDITDGPYLDWPAFAKKMLENAWTNKETGRKYVKFDIYDQLKFRFDELIDFIWNYRHKYQRIKKEL